MLSRHRPTMIAALRRVVEAARRPELLAFLPALTLAAFWLGGEHGLLGAALGLPALFAVVGLFGEPRLVPRARMTDGVTGLALREGIVSALDEALRCGGSSGRSTCCFVLSLDDAEQVSERHGHAAMTHILRRTGERLLGISRGPDTVARLDGGVFSVALAPARRVDLEAMVQLATRLQQAAEAPVSLNATTLYISFSVGFCLAQRAPRASGSALLEAAEIANTDARRNGPGAIRAFTSEMGQIQNDRHILRGEIEAALDGGEIIAHFQPQVSTDTGEVTGFEALARWQHLTRGLLPPSEFLEALHLAGLSERLSEVMVHHALTALKAWDKAGLRVPTVAVNFSNDELRNPKLAERLKWDLDRFDLTPDRLTVEILETVVADTASDMIVRNIAALAAMGCGIDLDDFGTGHASIGNIRRFAVSRIKIDRSFVTRVDEDRDQQTMVAAILSMAERLGLETLAEGVETTGEHAMLAQLGCGHVQGFSLSRPLAFDDTIVWMEHHRTKLTKTPRVAKRQGGA